ncbi:hypothetical protein Ahy_B05g079452 [Arachis hypogaea]|uniref:Aminotransferase-like plant mobile domain-containing protein n=1 Tax=Arachis hypogaea TaxID=3818 RepID=A0A444Z9V1_ARAHY|nr:hypothetical protein Ahy_B05g079452 [Arachis hypogaea]
MAASLSHAAAQDKGKGPMVEPPAPPALHVLNQVNDEVIDDPQFQINDSRILIPSTVGEDVHCFIGPIENLEKANKKLPFFSSAQGKDLLINQALDISFFINQKSFRNNPKINPRGIDFTAWYERLAPTKSAAWGALGIQELLRLYHFSPSTLPWMIGAVTFFWNRITTNFHLLCGMIGMSLLDIAAITGLPISPPYFTSDMQPRQQYNIAPMSSYSDFIAHHMGKEGGLLQLWLNAIFEKYMIKPKGGATDKQHIESFRLADFKPNFIDTQSDEDQFWAVLSLFHSCKDFYNEKYNCSLEEINRSAVRTAPAAEGSPKRTQKRKADTTASSRQPQRKSRRTPTRTSRRLQLQLSSESSDESEQSIRNILTASSQSEVTADSDPGLQLIRRTRPIPDHSPTNWINDAALNKLLSDLLNSAFELPDPTPHSTIVHQFKQIANNSVATQNKLEEIENEEAKIKTETEDYTTALQPIKASREEFDLRISQAISVQAYYDKEEIRLEAKLAQINEKLAKIHKRKVDIATPLATVQQEQ